MKKIKTILPILVIAIFLITFVIVVTNKVVELENKIDLLIENKDIQKELSLEIYLNLK